ncbi:MAG: amidase [Candidatus Nanopelagicales bacterium]|nr:amidase [Candidatus Nanopelagicales bacterium]
MSKLHDLTALEQAKAIRAGTTSALELAEHYIHRSERLTDDVGAFVELTPELALDQARAADARVRAASADDVLPPLLGVVCPVKDLDFVSGIPTRFGSSAIDITPWEDDNVVTKLRAAGLVFTGKTNTPEMGLPCYTEPDVAPPARTPWDLTRSAAGSSGGAAAAVSSGLAPFAHGSDGGGSIRIPSSVTGLVGIKPSRGRVSNGPLRDPIGEVNVSGPIARTVADAAALLDAMAGGFPGDPFGAPAPSDTFLAAARRDPGKLRIGFYETPSLSHVSLHPDVATAVARTASALEELGHELVEVAPPFDDSILPMFTTVWNTLATLTPVAPDKEELLRPLTKHLRQLGWQISGPQLAGSISMLRISARAAMIATNGFDAILAPTIADIPALVGQLRNDDDPAADFDAQVRYSPFCAAYNVTGQPAINVPMNWNANGLPIGVQLVGRMFEEETIISLAAQLEAAHSWLGRYPAIW